MGPLMEGGGVSPSPMAALGGPDDGVDVQQQAQETLGKIRDLMAQVGDLAGTNPTFTQEAEQIRNLLRKMVLKAAQSTTMATPSSSAVPPVGV